MEDKVERAQSLLEKVDDKLVDWFGLPWVVNRQCHSIVERVRWVIPFLGERGGRILDAGSGGGPVAFALAGQGHAVTAMELEPRASNIQRRYAMLKNRLQGSIRTVTWDLRVLDQWPDSSRFDHIILFEVIEHILDDEKLVRDLANRLSPGARLYITTPNERYHGLLGDVVHETEDGDHVRWGYGEGRLREVCAMSGLEVEHVTYLCGFFGQQLINVRRAMHKFFHVNPNVTLAATYPLRALTRLDRFFPYEPLSIAVVAKARP